jgi:hypothetical protein
MLKSKTPVSALVPTHGSEAETQAVGHHHNSHVMNILPITTLRTIDLGGIKNYGSLFSIFCAKIERFFQRNYAPEYVHATFSAAMKQIRLGSHVLQVIFREA